MKNEHTPGPWKVADAGYRVFDGFGTLAPIYGANGVGLIAYVLKKDEDNAPIIAAAPEMFAELATLRAENARLKLAHENTWQALSRMVAKYEDVHTPAFLAFDEDFLAGRVALSSTKSDPLYAAAPEMLEALKAIAGIEAWINDNEMKAHFQKTVYGAIKAAELELRREELEKEVEPMSDEAYEAAISGVSDDHPGMD